MAGPFACGCHCAFGRSVSLIDQVGQDDPLRTAKLVADRVGCVSPDDLSTAKFEAFLDLMLQLYSKHCPTLREAAVGSGPPNPRTFRLFALGEGGFPNAERDGKPHAVGVLGVVEPSEEFSAQLVHH